MAMSTLLRTVGNLFIQPVQRVITVPVARKIHHLAFHGHSTEEIEARFIDFFNKPDVDGWDVRQGMNDILGLDMVPDPETCIAVLYACRRVNDYAIAVRFLEAVKDKCGGKAKEIYPYIVQEISPVLNELGVETPEDMGYDCPEMYVQNVFDM